MIDNKSTLLRFMEADRIALRRRAGWHFWMSITDPIWLFERVLRKREYYLNTQGRNPIKWILGKYYGWRLRMLGLKLGFSIPPNVFGEGLCIWHYGSIIVHPKTRIGRNAQLNSGVVIGKDDEGNCPQIGDNLMCQPGVKICGGIVLGDNMRCGLNAVVTRSYPEGHCVLVGVPARPIGKKHPKDL